MKRCEGTAADRKDLEGRTALGALQNCKFFNNGLQIISQLHAGSLGLLCNSWIPWWTSICGMRFESLLSRLLSQVEIPV